MKNWFKAIGIINIILGISVLFRNCRWTLYAGVDGIIAYSKCGAKNVFVNNQILLGIFMFIVSPMLPLARVLTGAGLIFLKRWAYRFTILILLVDFIIRFFGAVNYCAYCYLFRDIDISILISKSSHVGWVNMWPSYVAALIDLLFLSVLTRYEEIE